MATFNKSQVASFIVLTVILVGISWMFWDISSGIEPSEEYYMLVQVIRGTTVLTPFVIMFTVIVFRILQTRKNSKKSQI